MVALWFVPVLAMRLEADLPTADDPLPGRRLVRDDGPLYRQVTAILRDTIQAKGFPVGAPLPTEAQLAHRFGVSLITVRQALRQLETDGLIQKRAAKAAIVTAHQPRQRQDRGLNRLDDIPAFAVKGRLDIRSYRKQRAAIAAQVFGLKPNQACHCLRGVLLLDDKPTAIVTIFFPPEIGNRLTRADFDDVIVYRSVQRRLGVQIERVRVTVRAEAADAEVADALGCAVGSPILVNQMLFMAEGRPIELTLSRHRADDYAITYDLRND